LLLSELGSLLGLSKLGLLVAGCHLLKISADYLNLNL
jgi:hypothetical protein